MKSLTDHLATYAAYHRERRNVATHFVGIPMIVLSVDVLLARAAIPVSGWPVSLALVATVFALAFYVVLDRGFGLVMTVLLAASLWAGTTLAEQSFGAWLATGVGLFVVGWIIQFVGHAFEGRKPAFVDDLVGLLVGPLFLVAETAFAMGLRADVGHEVERRAGPMRTGAASPTRAGG